MSIVQDLIIMTPAEPDTLDVQPRGDGCYSGFCEPTPSHDWAMMTSINDFSYKICGRCGTVRISERRR